MLNDYITDYIKAKRDNDTKSMKQIEKDLAKLGMDKATLLVLVEELEKER